MAPGDCFERPAIIAAFDEDLGQQQLARGFAHEGKWVEVYVASDGEWTMAVVFDDLKTCIVASGEDWKMVSP